MLAWIGGRIGHLGTALLQVSGRLGNALAAHTQHLGDQFLGHGELV